MDQIYGSHLDFYAVINVNLHSTFVSIKFIHPIFLNLISIIQKI